SVAPLIRGLPSVDEVLIYDPDKKHAGFRGLRRLVAELKKRKFRIAVVLQSPWKIAAATFFANIRYRVGAVSKLHSYFFYNRGVRQHRSQVEMHETDYNLQLLRRLGIRVGARKVPVRVHYSPEAGEQAKEWLTERGWKPEEPLLLVHPGM